MLAILLSIEVVGIIFIVVGPIFKIKALIAIGAIMMFCYLILAPGLFSIEPNMGVILIFNGNYLGSVKENGYFWTPPLVSRTLFSLKKQYFETDTLKVNDKTGNPIMIQCVIVYTISNIAKAYFDIEDMVSYVISQSESLLRTLTSMFPYDSSHPEEVCLKDGSQEVNKQLILQLQLRMNKAGIKILDARLNRLNYSPEIAQNMLKRQQADAVIAARQKIVNGGVGIVKMAIDLLEANHVCEMTREEKVQLSSNLLTVVVSDSQGNQN